MAASNINWSRTWLKSKKIWGTDSDDVSKIQIVDINACGTHSTHVMLLIGSVFQSPNIQILLVLKFVTEALNAIMASWNAFLSHSFCSRV